MTKKDTLTISTLDSVNKETTTQQELNSLLEATNQASNTARATWVFFIAIMTYFFITIATVTHKDLLLNTPITLPVLNVSLPLKNFFSFAPLALLLTHFWVLIQHIMLSRKVQALDEVLKEMDADIGQRSIFFRLQLNAYFFPQLLADPPRSFFVSSILKLMLWITLAFLPIILLLGFQTSFLPFHNAPITWAQRVYVLLDLILLLGVGLFLRRPDASFFTAIGDIFSRRPIGALIAALISLVTLFFSFAIATIPDSATDRAMATFWPAPVKEGDDYKEKQKLFWPTKYLIDQKLLSRNLFVVNQDLVSDLQSDPHDVSIRFNNRDLRYANFFNSDLHRADFSGADLTAVSFKAANLQKAKFSRETIFRNTSFYGAQLQEAQFQFTKLRNTSFSYAQINNADFNHATALGVSFISANLAQANFYNSILKGARFDNAILHGANINAARLQGASLKQAQLQGIFGGANFQGADLSDANLQGADFYAANLNGAILHRVRLQGANLNGARILGADLKEAQIWNTQIAPGSEQAAIKHLWHLTDLSKATIAPLDKKQLKALHDLIKSLKSKKLAAHLKERLSKLLEPEPENEENWNKSKDYLTLNDLAQSRPNPKELSLFLAKLACENPSSTNHKPGNNYPFLAHGIALRIANFNLRYNGDGVIFIQNFKTCTAYKGLTKRLRLNLENALKLYSRLKPKPD